MLDTFEFFIGPHIHWKVLALGFSVALGGFLRGFVGFGGALVIVPVLVLVVGPLAAVPIASLSGLPAVLQLLPTAIRDSERRFVGPIALTAFLGAPLGAWTLVTTEPKLLKIAITALVLAMVVFLYRGWSSRSSNRRILAGAGLLSGWVQGVAGIGGPPAVAVALSRPGTPHQQRANVLAVVAAITLSTPIPLWWHGLFTREVLITSIGIIPVYAVFTWLGARFFTEGGAQHYRNAALVTLALVGGITLIVAIREYTGL